MNDDDGARRDEARRDGAWKQVKAEWRDVVLVCRKCSRKLDGGFGPDGDETLAKALRRSLGGDGARKGGKGKARRRAVAVVEVGCLDVCPKGAVVALRAAAPGRWILVPEGADTGDVAERLGLTGDAGAVPRTIGPAAAFPGTS